MEKEFLHNGAIADTKILEMLSQYNAVAEVGGQASFLGRVRADVIDGKSVVEIEYSAYAAMVNKEFEAIEKEFMQKYDDLKTISMQHAIGKVRVGEVALAVCISGGHRKQAFVAIKEIVDAIKDRVPVWKKEILDQGDYVWTENA